MHIEGTYRRHLHRGTVYHRHSSTVRHRTVLPFEGPETHGFKFPGAGQLSVPLADLMPRSLERESLRGPRGTAALSTIGGSHHTLMANAKK